LMRVSLDVQTSLALFARVFEYLDLQAAVTDRPDARVLGDGRPVRGQVQLRRVWFHYPGQEVPQGGSPDDVQGWALRGVDLLVEPGQLAAIVGPSGAGKTTLSYLVPRLYDVQRGAVLLDGNDVRELTLASLTDAIGMVTQDTYLFHATVADNLRYARDGASAEDLEAAARSANIHDRIMSFEGGYDTVVGERGYRLSGGEKQRLAIARVLLKAPAIVILDEATAHLDSESEVAVQRALAAALQGRTSLVIAHRLSTIRSADLILVVDGGRVVQSGTHAELMAEGGLYSELYRTQFEHQAADPVPAAAGAGIA